MIDQEKIHNQCLSDNREERKEALDKLRDNFSSLSDKQQAWNDLHKLTIDEDSFVRSNAAWDLGSLFSQLPDKQQAWEDLHRLTNDQDRNVRSNAAWVLFILFPYLLDKQQALDDLLRLSKDEDSSVRSNAAEVLNSLFSKFSSKLQAWANLLRLSRGEGSSVEEYTAEILDYLFSQFPDKTKACDDLFRLFKDKDSSIRSSASEVLDSLFSEFTVTQQALNDLHTLTYNLDWTVRSSAAEILGSLFSQLPNKEQAWDDLIRLSKDEDSSVRSNAACAFDSAFSQVPNKLKAWSDLHTLICDVHWTVRSNAAEVLGSLFSQLHDKEHAWNDLHRLTKDEVSDVRSNTAWALGISFSDLPDKELAWNDLHRLTNDQDRNVRSNVAEALSISFPYLPDKQQAWDDLLRLTNDVHWNVRTLSNYSLARISIFKASQANKEEDYKSELEKAIDFFEKAPKESSDYLNPSKFCLPFYRSFHAIVFKKKEPKEEVNKYLDEAKAAIEDSESKELLLKAVEYLAKALEEVHSIENLDLEAKKSELNFYRKYCDRAVELMIDSEEVAPYATGVIRKGLPILDRNLKELLEEIKEKAKIACKESKGTATQGIACIINSEVQERQISDPLELEQFLEDMAYSLKRKITDIPENDYLLYKIELMKNEKNTGKKLRILSFVIENLPTIRVVPEQELDKKLDQKLQQFDPILGEIVYIKDKLSCISFDISKIKLNSADVISDLETIKKELEKLSKIEGLNTLSIEKLDPMQAERLSNLNSNILERLNEIKILIFELSKDNDELYQEYSRRLDRLKQSKFDTLLQRYSAAISLISFAISGIQIAR